MQQFKEASDNLIFNIFLIFFFFRKLLVLEKKEEEAFGFEIQVNKKII